MVAETATLEVVMFGRLSLVTDEEIGSVFTHDLRILEKGTSLMATVRVRHISNEREHFAG